MNDARESSVPQVGAILAVLSDHEVDFVLIGGVAGIAHGSAYPTYDLDIAYSRDPENLARLAEALRELRAHLRVGRMSNEEAANQPFQLDAGTLEKGANFTLVTERGALDLLGEPGGIRSYDDLAGAAETFAIDGLSVRVASIDHMIAMKRHAARPKDKLALEEYIVLADVKRQRDLGRREPEPE